MVIERGRRKGDVISYGSLRRIFWLPELLLPRLQPAEGMRLSSRLAETQNLSPQRYGSRNKSGRCIFWPDTLLGLPLCGILNTCKQFPPTREQIRAARMAPLLPLLVSGGSGGWGV